MKGPLGISPTSLHTFYLFHESQMLLWAAKELERFDKLKIQVADGITRSLGLEYVAEKVPSAGGVVEDRGGKYRNTKNYMSLPFNPKLKERAKELRKAGNLSEVLFWLQVKNKQFKGLDFDRQKIVGNYIVDFYCGNCNVVIEIDGSSHDDKVEYDAVRDKYLTSLGLIVIHIPVVNVLKNLNGVMAFLHDHPAFTRHVKGHELMANTQINHPALPGTENEHSGRNSKENNHPALPGTENEHSGRNSKENNHPALPGTPPAEGKFTPIVGELRQSKWAFEPFDILDYIYAVLHSQAHRKMYKEFLKTDFPKVPYPKDAETFWRLVKLGGELRRIHMLESPKFEKCITQYPVGGDNLVSKPSLVLEEGEDKGKVFINDTQYFNQVPKQAWELFIGEYQPGQKWLKDRMNRMLEFDDILHYQRIIEALVETGRLMAEIDKIALD